MSYQDDGRRADLGALDHASWMRNRDGFALKLAAERGRERAPAWSVAIQAAGRLSWRRVWSALPIP